MQNEFQRLTGEREGPQKLIQAGLQKYADPIVKICRSLKKMIPCVEQALESVGLQREEKSRRGTMQRIIIFIVFKCLCFSKLFKSSTIEIRSVL